MVYALLSKTSLLHQSPTLFFIGNIGGQQKTCQRGRGFHATSALPDASACRDRATCQAVLITYNISYSIKGDHVNPYAQAATASLHTYLSSVTYPVISLAYITIKG